MDKEYNYNVTAFNDGLSVSRNVSAINKSMAETIAKRDIFNDNWTITSIINVGVKWTE